MESMKNESSVMKRLKESGLIGCLNDTGITSQNYKSHLNMQWTQLEKEMPPMGEWILGLTEGGGIFQIRRIGNTHNDGYNPLDWMLPYYVRDDAIFTHWMPMPESPMSK